MKKLLLLAGFLILGGIGKAHAEAVFDVGYSTGLPIGVICTTGTVVQINATRPTGFTGKVVGYRVQNQDSADSVWNGGPNVSTTTTTSADLTNLGERLVAGADAPFPLGYDYQNSRDARLYCRAADSAGASGVVLSVYWFGY